MSVAVASQTLLFRASSGTETGGTSMDSICLQKGREESENDERVSDKIPWNSHPPLVQRLKSNPHPGVPP